MRQAFLLLAVLAIAGCATDNSRQQPAQVATTAPAGQAKQVCTRERHVGSEIPVTTCGPALSDSERAAQMHDLENQIRMQQQLKVPGSGG